jgi:glycosyltransferase involved in cell wall biosynthesis
MNQVSVILPTIGRQSLYLVLQSMSTEIDLISEIIVVNDSGRGLELGQYDLFPEVFQRIFQIDTAGGIGPAKARNLAITISSAQYIAFADDDDPWIKGRLFVQLNQMKLKGLKASLCLNLASEQNNFWTGDLNPIDYLYSQKGFFRHKRFLPLGSLVIERDSFNDIDFPEFLNEREDLWYFHILYNQNNKFSQLPVYGLRVKRQIWRSIRRPSSKDDIQWFLMLKELGPNLARNFLVYVAIRNAIVGLQFRKLFTLLGVLIRDYSHRN